MRVFQRDQRSVVQKEHEFYPFFFLTDSTLLEGFPQKHWIKKLDGGNDFRFLCAFTRWSDMWEGVNQLITRSNERTGGSVASYADLPSLHLRPDAVSQFLMQTGMTLFKGMEFDELHRLQLDIETYSARGSKFSNASRPEDRIILVALSDNRGWEEVVGNPHMTEDALLREVIGIIRKRDPDVIEGHNIYNFDLPYMMARCRLHGIEFRIGRDGSPARSFESRSVFAERAFDYTVWEIAGRHIVDTWLLLQAYDASKRTLESYGLKQAARHFGFARSGREYIQPDRISWTWEHEPDRLFRYASDDVYETRMLAEYLSPTYFYLSNILPFNYGTVARIGSAAKIESLIVREYVRRKHSIPRPRPGLQTTGGYADIYHTGILGPIVDVDVESLYPSIMLSGRIGPCSETLGVFHHALESLTEMRINTKRKMQRSRDAVHRSKYDAMQSSFKILINSFYGYLGYTRALFSDPEAADRVTQTGQRMLRTLIAAIGEGGGIVIMVDTDGIFFVPPPGVLSGEDVDAFVARVASSLPGGIRLAVNGRYSLIMSYKKKNYALLGEDGRVKIKGSSLTSRNVERFGRNYLRECIEALLRRDIEALHSAYARYHRDLGDHALSVEEFARVETLKESMDQYAGAVEAGARNKSANYEAAIASGNRWRPGDRISYYITGSDVNVRGFEHARLSEEWDPNFPDENVRYYQKRLDELSRKFEPFFSSGDFRKIFSVDDLFPFSPEGIEILTQPVAAAEGGNEEESETAPAESPNWTDEG